MGRGSHLTAHKASNLAWWNCDRDLCCEKGLHLATKPQLKCNDLAADILVYEIQTRTLWDTFYNNWSHCSNQCHLHPAAGGEMLKPSGENTGWIVKKSKSLSENRKHFILWVLKHYAGLAAQQIPGAAGLTHWGRVTHIYVDNLGHHWLR